MESQAWAAELLLRPCWDGLALANVGALFLVVFVEDTHHGVNVWEEGVGVHYMAGGRAAGRACHETGYLSS